MSETRRVVIVGNGIAGVLTASQIRFLEPDAGKVSLDIYTREEHEHYSRIRLPEVFASEIGPEALRIYKPEWYEGKHIRVHRNESVVAIDRENRTIRTRDGAAVVYDDLVLATGAEPVLLPVRGTDLRGVHTVREFGDAEAVRRRVASGTRQAAVVGGGILGLEAAHFLQAAGVSVTILELEPRLLPRQLDEKGSRILRALVEKRGCRVLLRARVEAFAGAEEVESVRLAGGMVIDAQTVLITAGVRPRVELARQAGLEVARGVVVNELLRSSDPRIWAVGDVVEFQGAVWGIIPAAMELAPVVAANLLGREPVRYHGTIPRNTLKVAGIELESMGDVNPVLVPGVEVIDKIDETRGHYEKYVLRDGLLSGCVLLGSSDNHGFARSRIGKATTPDEVRSQIR